MPEREFKLPDLGEGLTEGDIVRWLVAEGDAVTLNQPIVEVETAKAVVEVPSPYAGKVTKLHAAEGETLDVGAPLISVDTGEGAAPAAPAGATPQAAEEAVMARPAPTAGEPGLDGFATPEQAAEVTEPAQQATLVGPGERQQTRRRRIVGPRSAVDNHQHAASGSATLPHRCPR